MSSETVRKDQEVSFWIMLSVLSSSVLIMRKLVHLFSMFGFDILSFKY